MNDERDGQKRMLKFAAGAHRYAAAKCDLTAATLDATTAMEGFNRAWRRGEEAAFLEMVVRFDEPAKPARPWKTSATRRFNRG